MITGIKLMKIIIFKRSVARKFSLFIVVVKASNQIIDIFT